MGIINIKYKTPSLISREDVLLKENKELETSVTSKEELESNDNIIVGPYRRLENAEMQKIYKKAVSKFAVGSRVKTFDGEEYTVDTAIRPSTWRTNARFCKDDIVYVNSDIGLLIPIWKNGEWAERLEKSDNDNALSNKSVYFIDYENTQDIFAFRKTHPDSELVIMFGLNHIQLKVNALANLSGRKIHYFKNNFAGPNVADAFLMYIVGIFEDKYDLDTNFIFVSKDKLFSKMIADIRQMNNIFDKKSRTYRSTDKI